MILNKLAGRGQGGYTTFGAVWEKGEARECCFRAQDGMGNEIPMQSRGMAYWSDGSLKWSSHTLNSEQAGDQIFLQPALEEKRNSARDANTLVTRTEGGYQIETTALKAFVPEAPSNALACGVILGEKEIIRRIYPVFLLERRSRDGGTTVTKTEEFRGEVTSCELEENGSLQAVFCFRGNHVTKGECRMPFVIRMYLWHDSTEIKFVQTFLYDGKEDRDFLKGMGIRYETVLSGKRYYRHIRFVTDGAAFHETGVMMNPSHPKIPPEVYQSQMAGKHFQLKDVRYDTEKYPEIENSLEETGEWVMDHMPVWNDFSLCQDSAYHYRIQKRTQEECCYLTCCEGRRTSGGMAISGSDESILFGIRDFWQKYPSGMEVRNLSEDVNHCTIWFYSPCVESYDFRHYDTRAYPKTCYEGFDWVGASAYGIGVTSECMVRLESGITAEKELEKFDMRVQKPPVYTGTPEYYHDKHAFGYFSLPERKTEMENWFEEQMEKAFFFYRQEIEERNWYGLFDYGDFMHSYDPVRHVWKYDIGGFAWQNTELVPTYWLWLYFLRTGREDVYTVAEAMSRHASEVDIYHFGPLKGMGSRHNVRHWGCSCKEPRIAMAGHHRFLCYLTGDLRLKDIFEEVKDADYSLENTVGVTGRDENGKALVGVRSGPDWSSFVSNWMTWYELTLDEKYREKIETGICDIALTPYGLASGPDYDYERESSHLIYRGEIENTPNQHLQICMGGPQIWLEMADMLENDTMRQLLIQLGRFYCLSPEEKSRLTNGLIFKRPFSWPMFAAGIIAYSAKRTEDGQLGRDTWKILFDAVYKQGGVNGYQSVSYAHGTDMNKSYAEIPWISTNSVSQWCLNVIMSLEFAREYLPEYLDTFIA